MRRFTAYTLSLLLPAFAVAGEAKVDPTQLGAHVKAVSSDAFEGRGPATPGEVKTVDYLVSQMEKNGLKPGGDKGPTGSRT